MWKKIKLILKSVREYKKYAIITPLMMIGEALMECMIPWEMTRTIEATRAASDFSTLIPHIFIMIAMALISIACGYIGGMAAAKASTGLARNLRMDIYNKIQTFSFANIDKFSSSSLITRMTTDVSNVQNAFQMCIRIVVRAPLMLIFSAIMAFVTGGNLAWMFIILVPFVAFGLFLIVVKAMPVFKRMFKKYDALNASIEENVSGIRVVKSYVREDYEMKKFNKAANGIKKDSIIAEKILAVNNPLLNTTIHLSNIAIIALGSWMICNSIEGINAETMSALITYGIQVLMSLMMISMILVMLTMSLEAVNRVSEVLMEKPTITNPKNTVMEVKDGSVDFNHVFFKYFKEAEKNTLEDIDIHIKSGEFVGVIGSTGSGKTSFVNLISRLYDVSEGELLVGGVDVRQYDLKTLRKEVAVVLQKNVLFSGTIASNLRWGNENATEEDMKKACNIARADEFIETLKDGYESKVEQGGNNFSGGQKQRLCIARAIMSNPKVLILDDSTSAVDTKTDRLIRKGLKEVIPGTTKFVIAQRISSIEDADHIIVMDNGKINAIGTHDELIKSNTIYQEVYYSQNKKEEN